MEYQLCSYFSWLHGYLGSTIINIILEELLIIFFFMSLDTVCQYRIIYSTLTVYNIFVAFRILLIIFFSMFSDTAQICIIVVAIILMDYSYF
ncbi:hypothetical protein M6B38_307095 [Iris pallida]|uniref:Uncharacterized protein n=1 Tax=Iris pallida TaxID=29817 RepID=A0AAX6G9I5_IRIPA|nr:hypothetical protein M6B38_380730 [Iris pallida]KAJ6841368.1 hypothetical protein M6B38_307095 [Iris pallida]